MAAPPDTPPRRVVVICPNLIGDAVMATPTLRALRAGWPEARIVAVLRPNVAPVLDGAPWIDGRILFAPRAADRRHRLLGAVGALRRERADVAVLLPNSFRSAWLALLAGIPRRVGYARGGRAVLLTDRLAPPRDASGRWLPMPAVDYYLALARLLGCPPAGGPRPELFTTADDEARADLAWNRLGLGLGGAPVVCLNTGGAFGPAKSWPAGHFAALARRLADEAGADVLMLCGPAEREAARAIVAAADHPRVTSLAEEVPSIGLSKACVRRAALLVTTDSGPRHFAGALGTPVVALFGPTHIGWTRTYQPNAVNIQQPVPCGPCQRPTCAEGHHRCMVDLNPDAVFRAAVGLIGRASRRAG